MKTIIAIGLIFASAYASADTLTIRANGVETVYSGIAREVNVDSPSGGIVFDGIESATGPADISAANGNAFGEWTVTVNGETDISECAFFESTHSDTFVVELPGRTIERTNVSRDFAIYCR